LVVVRLPAPLPVADDGFLAAQRTPPWYLLQLDPRHPGSVLSSAGRQ
jgi:hypothetical protein